MATKKGSMLLIFAALLAVGLIGFLIWYMMPCGVTIEKFQDAPPSIPTPVMTKKVGLPPPPSVSMAPSDS